MAILSVHGHRREATDFAQGRMGSLNTIEAKVANEQVKRATKFILLLGIVSLFADMTYEGARGITGSFLGTLGASGAVVGVVSGLGEFAGYGLRIVSGYISDRTGRYWLVTMIGYFLNLLAVPALALAGKWQIAAALIILERTGKAIRNPARDTMLSHATSQVGHGWGFAIHEAMDQIGAILGPVIVAVALGWQKDYRAAFASLLVPAALALTALLIARILYPKPRDLEVVPRVVESKGLPNDFWIYILAVGLVAAGYADFPLIAYHLQRVTQMKDVWIPALYAGAMGIDAISALIFGRLFDKIKVKSLLGAISISTFFAPFAFGATRGTAVIGIALWGIGMGAQESIMRAAVAELVAPERRGSAYGILNAAYGLFWFLGSALMGLLYDRSITAVVMFSVLAQIAAIAVLTAVVRKSQS